MKFPQGKSQMVIRGEEKPRYTMYLTSIMQKVVAMQPSKIEEDIARLKNAWELFTSTGKILEDAGLNPLLLASWMRCGLRMNPNGLLNWTYASENTLNRSLKQHELFAVARRFATRS